MLLNYPLEQIQTEQVTESLLRLISVSSAIGVIAAVLLLWLPSWFNKYRNGKWTISGKSLTIGFCVTWILGFIVYDIGMCHGGVISLLFNAPMAMIHAFEMFILESDIAAIHPEFHHNLWYMLMFSLVHFAAAFISMFFVIKHFGYNILAGFRMFFEAYFKKNRSETFVFWGMNEPSFLLAKSIKQKLGDRDDYRIIIVRTGNDGDSTSVRNGLERLLNFRALKNKDLERLQDLGCLTTSTFVDVSKLDMSDLRSDDNDQAVDIFRKHLNLRQLATIMSSKTTSAVHLFFLGDDASVNIQSIANLKSDKTVLGFAQDKHKVDPKIHFYCRARYNSVHRVIEDDNLKENIEVTVIDSSRISIEELKQNVSLHPVNYVDIADDATVSSPFNALVVGFGEVGIDAVRFLYEFGAFVKQGTGKDSEVERSDFHCDVVDAKMPVLAGPFLANAPAIPTELILKDGTKVPRWYKSDEQADEAQLAPDAPNSNPMLSLHELDMKGVVFFKKLENWVKKLNYVVIAANDDEQNMALAVRIFKLAVRYRDNIDHFRILVCVKHDNDGHIRRTAEHYNRLWAAEQVGIKKGNPLHQKQLSTNETVDAPITVFGLSESIYTYDYVISNELVNEAIKFKERYDSSIAALRRQMGEKVEDSQTWFDEYMELMQLNKEFKGFSPTFSGMTRLRRIQTQNRQNCLHLYTKQRLAREALGEKAYASLTSHNLYRKENKVEYQCADGAKPDPNIVTVLDVLAKTEHLRWCASHEILGYREHGDCGFKDEAKLLHGCLAPWESLTEAVKSYDYNVVDVSLGIISDNSQSTDTQSDDIQSTDVPQ